MPKELCVQIKSYLKLNMNQNTIKPLENKNAPQK